MCGIAGGVALERGLRPDPDRVRRMAASMAYRGPDGDGLWISPSGSAVLAHRRLSVIDLECGAQPMITPDGHVGLTFNGEIYNFLELREHLVSEGCHFRTNSDTEVLLASFLRHGCSCFERFHGMFALALWDDSVHQLTLVRDRLGKKPLFYTVTDGCLYFSSTLESLRTSAPRPWTVSRSALETYLSVGYVPAPSTIYTEACKLEAGTLLTASPGSGIQPVRYWDEMDAFTPFEGTFSQAVRHTQELLCHAVQLRLRSDVPLGLFLSGGVDSSLLAAIAARECGVRLNTFSIGFDNADHDESDVAAAVARHLGTQHHAFHVQPDLLSVVPTLVAQFGEPLADAAALPLWVLARETRRHVTVALGGDGGDEAFGGYRWYRTFEQLERIRTISGGSALTGVRTALSAALASGSRSTLSARAGRALHAIQADDPGVRYATLRMLFSDTDRHRVLIGDNTSPIAPLDRTPAFFDLAGGDVLHRMRYADIRTYLADCLNPKVDVATMSHALEARAPLLDHRLVAFGLSLPKHYLVDRRGGKRILRTLLTQYLPREIINRPKHGFTVPLDDWFRGAARHVAEGLARSESLASLGQLEMDSIAALCTEHLAGRRNHGERLYSLLVLDLWARRQ
jgi:asparagine synthase (glutamine-hydrolysing)